MFKSVPILLLLTLSICFAKIQKARYDNYKVIRIDISTTEQLNLLKDIEDFDTAYNFWESPEGVGTSTDIVIPPYKFEEIESFLNKFNFKYETTIENLQAIIDNEKIGNADDGLDWEAYYPLEAIYEWLGKVAQENSKYVTPFEIGKSYEGRPILGVKISYKEGNPGIFIESNIHAREWITSATVTWIINEFLNSEDPAVRDLAENIDWYIIPVLNVDGFEYSHTTDRQWRKTRIPVSSLCFGTDANRNFDYLWFTGGSSNNPCSNTYAGPNAFSEPETKALASFYDKIHQNITAYFSFHNYGQYLLYPYGSPAADRVSNEDEHQYVGQAAIAKLEERYGTKYTTGDALNVLYAASGISIDWAKGVYDVPFSFTYEFRDKGKLGFLLPADQIIPNAEEHQYVGQAAIAKLEERYGTKYTTGDALNVLYAASGISIDWAKGVYDVPFSFTYEFRDKGKLGFLLPADQIIPNAEEVLDSLIEFVAKARDLGYFKK
uniref:Zinc carboxypeptidase A 1 n=1 Tax=Culicoides sonorensis TaxID=179676 RepID=A0A336K8H3_CULSO